MAGRRLLLGDPSLKRGCGPGRREIFPFFAQAMASRLHTVKMDRAKSRHRLDVVVTTLICVVFCVACGPQVAVWQGTEFLQRSRIQLKMPYYGNWCGPGHP